MKLRVAEDFGLLHHPQPCGLWVIGSNKIAGKYLVKN